MVIIKDFKMPDCCEACPLYYDDLHCILNTDLTWRYWDKGRHPLCPLKEIMFDFQPVALKFNNSISKQDLIDALEMTTMVFAIMQKGEK